MSNETTGIGSSNSVSIPDICNSTSNNSETKKVDNPATDEVTTQKIPEKGLTEESGDQHVNRIQNLRSELNYINATDWMYESLDKKPQQ